MRLFTAIDIAADVRERLRLFVAGLKPLAKITWSPVDNLHITTKFIGEWPEARLAEVKSALSAAKADPMEIAIRSTGWFPNDRRPRVFWAGVEAPESLAQLAHRTEAALATIGVPVEDRPYSPHLTLARIRESVNLGPLRAALEKAPMDFGSFRATEFFLYLSAAGKYTKLERFPL